MFICKLSLTKLSQTNDIQRTHLHEKTPTISNRIYLQINMDILVRICDGSISLSIKLHQLTKIIRQFLKQLRSRSCKGRVCMKKTPTVYNFFHLQSTSLNSINQQKPSTSNNEFSKILRKTRLHIKTINGIQSYPSKRHHHNDMDSKSTPLPTKLHQLTKTIREFSKRFALNPAKDAFAHKKTPSSHNEKATSQLKFHAVSFAFVSEPRCDYQRVIMVLCPCHDNYTSLVMSEPTHATDRCCNFLWWIIPFWNYALDVTFPKLGCCSVVGGS